MTPAGESSPVEIKEITLDATYEEQTKTSYTSSGSFSWTAGDQISV